jgi:hypothetical protein
VPRIAVVAALVCALILLAAAPAGARALRLSDLQVVGTHNSFHLEPSPAERALIVRSGFVDPSPLDYSFPPLAEQLEGQDVRQIELDVFADPRGARYATPRLRALTGKGAHDPVMGRPGSKVLHLQDYDYRSTCLTLVACLREVRTWSDRHRGHVPLAILLELKDRAFPVPSTIPLAWTRARMDALDREIQAVFARRRLIVPDDVRGRWRTLEDAVRRQGWPTLDRTGGRLLFVLISDTPHHRRAYLAGHRSLRGRVLFTSSAPGRSDAAVVKVDDPTGRGASRIRSLVRRGYLVRTRADVDTRQARTNDVRRRDLALESGAHWVSTDYPAPGMAARFGSPYVTQLGRPARCNPVTAPADCASARLERR